MNWSRPIRAALDDTQLWQQASLFEIEAERAQLRKDHDALPPTAWNSDPGDPRAGTACPPCSACYADPQARWFPAAITFLVPAAIANAGGMWIRPAPRSSRRRRTLGGDRKTIAQRHAEWACSLRADGPFIAIPVLAEAFPQYLDEVPADTLDKLRLAWAEVERGPGPADAGLGEARARRPARRHAADPRRGRRASR